MNVGVARGSSALAELSGALDALNEETSAPIMARRPWLATWVSCYPDHEPWTIYVEGPRGLEAAALLARRRRRGVLEIVRMGHGATDHARLPSRDQRSARILAEAISSALEATRGPWRLFLGQLPVGDPVTKEIVATLPTAALVPSDGSPTVRLEQGGSIDEFLSRKMRSNLRTRMNRLQREGLSADFSRLREAAEIEQILPETERVRRERDAELGRSCKLDDPRYLSFRRMVLVELAKRREVELTTLRIGDELVAYQVGLLDGEVYRQWDSRFSPAWRWFAPGGQLNAVTLGWVLEDRRFREFDFMRGIHPHKLELATDVIPAETLVAWSSSLSRRFTTLEHQLKRLVKRDKERSSHPSGPVHAPSPH